MNDLEFIKKFAKITISGVCKKNKIDRSALLVNRYRNNSEKAKIIREEIESEIAKLYIKED